VVEEVSMIAARRLALPSLLVTVIAVAMPGSTSASPARRLARQGVIVVPVPTATPAPAVVMPLPGAVPVVAARPLRPWRKSLVQPVAVLVPVPGVPLVAAPTSAEPAHPAPLVVPAPHQAAPAAVAPQPAGPPVGTVEAIPAPAPQAGRIEPDIQFGTP
jgi:hypothetical protein